MDLRDRKHENHLIMKTSDLTLRPPRSPRIRLGGYAILPRLLDKARAEAAGTAGEYKFNSTLDSLFFGFTGIAATALLDEAKADKSDTEILNWIETTSPLKHSATEIQQWSAWTERFALNDVASREWFTGEIKRLCPARADIETIFEYLDVDDFVTFGGKA
jgi:hypothetical protein